ncbi:MAG: hypothetical protein LBT40_15665 [Deltaproteobacteria bacterium]|jgi:hypothetical protein|nr:hypothetical protein [Deltaproteobacteria bacterium]
MPVLPSATALRLALASVLAVWLLSPVPLSAQGIDPALLENQPPLTQADVPAALAALREMNNDSPDPARMEAIATEHGITQERLGFLIVKFVSGAALLSPDGPSAAELETQAGTPLAIPTPEEMEVIRGAFDQIVDVLND